MATTKGECKLFVSDDLLVAQDEVKSIGETIKSLAIEFDQAAFEMYLSRF